MYNRIKVNKNCDKIFKFFKNNYPGFPLLIDVLVNNPWETTDDTLYTLNYLLSHAPSQSLIGVNSLVFYRGTKLYEKAKQDNLLEPQHFLKTWVWHRQKTIHYTTLLFVLLRLRISKTLIRFFALKPFIIVFEKNIFISSLFPGIVMTFKKVFHFFKSRD
ncbi:MAG: hypothetical protein LWW97_00465 [Deltaproteobacteria bacterium]|nr:hypothetical protein [Deltaproteobacteria bacterium]